MGGKIALTAIGAVTLLSIAILLGLVTFSTATPRRVRLARACALAASAGVASWLVAAALVVTGVLS